jgi:hypothetical protein
LSKIPPNFFIFSRRPDFAAYISDYIRWPVPGDPYLSGQAKPTNKNGNFLMSEKVTGKRADISREPSDQISALCY